MGSFSARLKAVPFPVNIKIQVNTKVKGDGQERPSHTSKVKGNLNLVPRPFWPDSRKCSSPVTFGQEPWTRFATVLFPLLWNL
jgi:hypothetical protein